MGRTPRRMRQTGFLHVVVRGNGRQLIFEDDDERYTFLNMLRSALRSRQVGITSWCLMDNHVHLLVSDEEGNLSTAMQALLTRYARFFNRRAGHVGHVFQERFSALPIEDDAHLVAAVRYVHVNPQRAGIARASEYRWSSYGEFVNPGAAEFEVVDQGQLLNVLDMVGGVHGFEALCALDAEGAGVDYQPEPQKRMSIDEARAVALGALSGYGLASLGDIKCADQATRMEMLRHMRSAGLSVRQIERLTGIGRSTVSRLTRGTS